MDGGADVAPATYLREVAETEPGNALEQELHALAARTALSRHPHSRRERLVVVDRRRRTRALRRTLILADVVGMTLAFVAVQGLISAFERHDLRITALLLAGIAGWVGLAQMYGLYDHDELGLARSTADDLPGIVILSTLAAWLGLLVVNGTGLAHPKLHVAGSFWGASIVVIALARVVARALVRRRSELRERTLIIGTGRVALRIAEKLRSRPLYGLDVVGFVDDAPLELPEAVPPYLGETARLEQLVQAYQIERVIVAFSTLPGDELADIFRRSAELGVRVDIVPRAYEVIGSRTSVHDLDGLPLVSVMPPRLTRPARLAKRAMDIAVGGLVLAALSPFIAFAAWRIKAGSPGPVFFRQERMGAGGRRFHIFKFRSMYVDADHRKSEIGHLNMHNGGDPRMFKIPDDPRVTPFGRFLRRWSLDEVPQLFNVLRGEMSLVGPRPLILDEDEYIIGPFRRRLDITPGVTGLWQVLGRSDIPFSEMITLDYLYVTNWSLWGDIKLLLRTVPVVLNRTGAY